MGDLSAHFSKVEFSCPCCGEVKVSPALVELLEGIREYSGLPISITSGYRCASHNAEVGGKPNSAHLTGDAADFWVSGDLDRFKFLGAAFMCDALRIGIGDDFIHVDVAHGLPNEVCWVYPE